MSKQQRKMALGIQPTGWTNDDFQEIGDDTPYQEILEQTREAGFVGGSTGHNYPKHVPSLLEALGDLRIASTWAGTAFTTCTTGEQEEAAFAEFQANVAFLRQVNAKDVVVAELANAVNQDRTKALLGERPKINEAQWFLLTELLNRAGKYAKDHKMQLSYHPHVGTCVMTLEESERLLKETNPEYVGLCLDTAHLCYGGADQQQLETFTANYADRITHVHLKNVRREVRLEAVEKDYSFYKAIKSGIFTVPGDPKGELNLDPIMNTLIDVGYSGWMVIEAEQVPDKNDPAATPLAYALMARRYLRERLGY